MKIERKGKAADLTLRLQPGEQANLHIICEGESPEPPEPPEPNTDWPNLPAGFAIVNDWDCSGTPAVPQHGEPYVDEPIPGSNGWRCIYNQKPGSKWPDDGSIFAGTPIGWTECIEDADAPASPKAVYRFTYPQGMQEGTAPGTCYLFMGAEMGIREIFMGMWWKPSEDFDLSNNGSKIAFLFNGGGGQGGQAIIVLGNDRRLQVLPEYPDYYNSGNYYMMHPNVNDTAVVLGAWHRLEWYLNVDTGQTKWWLDALLQGDHTGATNAFNLDQPELSPTYGGCCSHQRPYQCDYQYDHVVIAVPQGQQRGPRLGKKRPADFKVPERDARPWPQRPR